MTSRRAGPHRSDRRWIDDNGDVWASRWEHDVYHGLRSHGYRVRRCDESDTITYTTPVRQGRCLECSSPSVVQDRAYTADLFVVECPPGGTDTGSYLIETKGYFARDRRAMFIEVAKECSRIDLPLRIIFESNARSALGRGVKSTPVEYIHRYCKNVLPGVWNKKTNKVVWHER